MRASPSAASLDVEQLLNHLVGGADHLGRRLVATLADDQVAKFLRQLDIRQFHVAGRYLAEQAFTGMPERGTLIGARFEQVALHRLQALQMSERPHRQLLATARKSGGVVKTNPGASLIDLGDGVLAVEFHSKMNTVGGDTLEMLHAGVREAGSNFAALVVGNDAPNFSAGANVMLLLMSAQEEEWDEIDLAIRQFQGMTQAIKFSPKPVVIAPFGITLGGGVEMSLHAPLRQPHAELYMGLVEVGLGLLPGGGGSKEMVLRAIDSASAVRPGGRGDSVELTEAMKRAFETIAMAKVSTSAYEARSLGLLSSSDRITMNRDRLLTDAKQRALELGKSGYEPPQMRTDIPAPGENILAMLKLGVHLMRQGEYITEHEVKIGTKVAEVLCGGNVTPGTPVSEQYFLDLEREAFKSLCGEKKTQERIQYTLKTGKTLRN